MADLSGVIGTREHRRRHGRRQAPPGKGHHQDHLPRRRLRLHDAVGDKPDAPGPKHLSIFRFAAHDGIQSAMVVEEAINRKFTKVALLHDATNYGVSGRDDLLDQIKKQGDKLQVVTHREVQHRRQGHDRPAPQGEVARRPGHPDLGHRAGARRRRERHGQARHQGRRSSAAGRSPCRTTSTTPARTATARSCRRPSSRSRSRREAKAFIEAYHKAYGVTRIPSPVSAAQGYDAVLIFAAAVKQAGATDTQDDQRRARGPEGAGGRRHRHLGEAVLKWNPAERRRRTRRSAASRPSWAWSRTAASSSANEADRAAPPEARRQVAAPIAAGRGPMASSPPPALLTPAHRPTCPSPSSPR